MTTYEEAARTAPGRWANAGLWVLQVLLAASFALGGINKVIGEAQTVAGFNQIGGGDWFRIAIGIIELAGAAGLLIPRLSGLAALGIVALMVGAVVLHIVIMHGELVYVPATVGVFAAVVAWGRRGRTAELLQLVRRR
ncbi:MAG: DoxX family protein [Micromonosporaceae bacterium]